MSEPSRSAAAPGARVLSLWRTCSRLPLGPGLFSFVFGRMVPYSATVGARVVTLEPGHARLSMRDRRGVRNHLSSIHAVALANLGELASGLAMTTALPPGVRGIVRSIGIEYAKKARGALVAESRVVVPEVTGDTDFEVTATIRDGAAEVVATVRVQWRLGLAP
jgi:acyl-coenzyme A thioesterase PaaI-like protein